jgi:hypothetical protein
MIVLMGVSAISYQKRTDRGSADVSGSVTKEKRFGEILESGKKKGKPEGLPRKINPFDSPG